MLKTSKSSSLVRTELQPRFLTAHRTFPLGYPVVSRAALSSFQFLILSINFTTFLIPIVTTEDQTHIASKSGD